RPQLTNTGTESRTEHDGNEQTPRHAEAHDRFLRSNTGRLHGHGRFAQKRRAKLHALAPRLVLAEAQSLGLEVPATGEAQVDVQHLGREPLTTIFGQALSADLGGPDTKPGDAVVADFQ